MRRFLSLTLLVVLCFGLVKPVQAEDTWFLPSIGQQNENTFNCSKDGGVCLETVTHNQLNNIATAFTCTLGAVGCGTDQNNLVDNRRLLNSPLGIGVQGMAYLFMRPPITTTEYLAAVGERAGLVPKTYAQGLTFARLNPIFPIWKTLRDIAFAALSIVLLFDGFVIMFRGKINPQTVAKIENTIPNIIITMILIAFSMPIAALIIDLMYVAIAAGIALLGGAVGEPSGAIAESVKTYTTGGLPQLFGETFKLAIPFWDEAKGSMLGGLAGASLPFVIPAALGLGAASGGILFLLIPAGIIGGALLGGLTTGGPVNFMSALSPFFILIMLVYLLFLVSRLFFILLSCYIQIVISIIFSPILLLQNALPGQESFGNWWRGILGNCLAFVVTALLLYTGWAINIQVAKSAGTNFWTAPFISLVGPGNSHISQLVVGLISIGIANLIPQVIQKIKEGLKAKPAFQMSPAILGQPFGAALGKTQEIVQNIGLMKTSGLADRLDLKNQKWLGPISKFFS